MEVGVWCGAGILVLYNIVLQIKVYLLRKSAKEIRKDFQKLLKTNTNTIIRISSRDREMLRWLLLSICSWKHFMRKDDAMNRETWN